MAAVTSAARAATEATARAPSPPGAPAPHAAAPATIGWLDALRGVAMLGVFVQHLGDRFRPWWEPALAEALPPDAAPSVVAALRHAWWGVDLFFVLSGFSLSLGFLRAVSAGRRPDARAFFRRRVARIVPAYALALAAAIAAHPQVIAAPGFAASLAVHALLLQGYASPGGIVLIGAAWSLTTEAHFYLLFPLLAARVLPGAHAWRRGAAIGAAVVLASWIVRAALHAWLLVPGTFTAWLESSQRHWVVSRLDQFVLGMLAAAAWRALAQTPAAARVARAAPALVAALAAAAVVLFRLEGDLYLRPGGSWPYVPLSLAAAALVLVLAFADRARPAPAWLRAAGRASYGVFLWHQLALELVGAHLPAARGAPSLATLAATALPALAASFAIGAASWRWVEKPALARG